jgi:1-acyl-sn-glycerol-3-phosphate acyltransferase
MAPGRQGLRYDLQEVRRIGWLLINGLQAVILFLWTAFWVTVALLVRLVTGSPKLPLTIARSLWLPVALWTVGARLAVEASPLTDFSQPALFVANHRSFYDIPALVGAIPANLRFLAKREVRKIPFLGLYAAAMGMVFIDRADSESSRTGVDLMSDLLRDGASMASFPEGTRSRSGKLLPFKTGSFVAAIKSGVPVVPVAISGSEKVLPSDGFAPRPGLIRVSIGEPIPTASLTLEDRRQLADEASHRVVGMLEAIQDPAVACGPEVRAQQEL